MLFSLPSTLLQTAQGLQCRSCSPGMLTRAKLDACSAPQSSGESGELAEPGEIPEEASAPPARSQTAGHASLESLKVIDKRSPSKPPLEVRMAHSPQFRYGSAQRSALLADELATVQDAANAHGLHDSMRPAAAKGMPTPDYPDSARALHRHRSASRLHSNGHGSRSSRDHVQRERSQEVSHHSSSRDRSVDHRGKQSSGHERRGSSPGSQSRAVGRPHQRSNSRGKSPGEGVSASWVASILQLLSTVTLQSIRKCVARLVPHSNLTERMQEALAVCQCHITSNPECLGKAQHPGGRVCHALWWGKPLVHDISWTCSMPKLLILLRSLLLISQTCVLVVSPGS